MTMAIFYLLASAILSHVYFASHSPTILSALPILFIVPLPAFVQGASLFTTYLVYTITLLLSTSIYRLSSFHPLAHYPGPLLCKLTKLWSLYLARKGTIHLYYNELHKKYGTVVRIGPDELSILDADLLPEIFGRNGMSKGPLYDGNRIRKEGTLLHIRSLQKHAQARKPWNKAFSTAALSDYQEILVPRVMELTAHLRRLCQSAEAEGHDTALVDMESWISRFTFDFMGSFTFSGGFELMRDGDQEGILKNMDSTLYTIALCQPAPWLSPLIKFVGLRENKFAPAAFKQAKRRIAMTDTKRDLSYHLSAAVDPNISDAPDLKDAVTLSDPIIFSNATLAIIAGSDTTSSTVTGIIYYLCHNPEYFPKLRKEIDTVFPGFATDPKGILDGAAGGFGLEYGKGVSTELSRLSMLNAVIDETLRLLPAVPSSSQRAPEKGSGGKYLGPVFVSETTAVRVPIYALHRDPRYFSPNPDKFWPERWILDREETTNVEVKIDRSAFIPFSTGPANCAGKNLAMAEMRYLIAILIGLFDFKFVGNKDGEAWETELRDYFVWARKPLIVGMRVRGV